MFRLLLSGIIGRPTGICRRPGVIKYGFKAKRLALVGLVIFIVIFIFVKSF